MCYLYPQVYNDGCEVKVTPKKTSCVPCAEHAAIFQITRQPCHQGRVVISSFGLCPAHEQEPSHHHHEELGSQAEPEHADLTTGGQQRRRQRAPVGGQGPPQDGGPSASWFEIDVSDDDDKESVSTNHSRGSSTSSLTDKLWGGWMSRVWRSSTSSSSSSSSASATGPSSQR